MWEEKLAIYDQLIRMCSDFERKGKTVPYTSANGHMFSQLNKEGQIGIRLSAESRKAFMAKYQTTRFKSYGAFMRGYVLVPDVLLDDLQTLSAYLNESYEYVRSLEAKPSKNK